MQRRPRECTQMNRRRLGIPNGVREGTRKHPRRSEHIRNELTKGEHPNEPNELQSGARRLPRCVVSGGLPVAFAERSSASTHTDNRTPVHTAKWNPTLSTHPGVPRSVIVGVHVHRSVLYCVRLVRLCSASFGLERDLPKRVVWFV